jgi:GT2 family glycosyltransferase
MQDIGIIIVTHNSGADIGPCLDAALKSGAEVLVVDNASSDETISQIRQRGAALIVNAENRGFAAAVNQGVRALRSNYVLLLNPDAILLDSLEPLLRACSTPGIAAAGGKLVDVQNQVQAGFTLRRLPTPVALAFEVLLINRLWPTNPANWHYRCYGFDYNEPADVEQPAGAFLMFRRQIWEQLGGLDERFYPVWFEDVDFCKRIRDHGDRIYYDPRSVASHRGGHSIQKILLEKRQLYWYRSLLKYGFKHFDRVSSRLLCLAVMVGSCLRMAVGIATQRSLRPVPVYGGVMRLAGRYLLFGAT